MLLERARTDRTRNPTPPVSGTAAQNAAAAAKPFPAFTDMLVRVDAALTYHFYKNWPRSRGYAFEMFEKTVWRTDTLNPFIPGVSSTAPQPRARGRRLTSVAARAI
jgi:hypothetical protein